MMKLRRVYETAEEEGKSVEEVAVDRFGSLELFEEAKEERRILDEREGKRASRGGDRDRGRDQGRFRPGIIGATSDRELAELVAGFLNQLDPAVFKPPPTRISFGWW